MELTARNPLAQITEHLTANGAYAAQIIADTTRLNSILPPATLNLAIRALQNELSELGAWEGGPREQEDVIHPDYYKFGDVQAIAVSRNLTSDGGQAFQYVVRSTRKDGNNKGDPRENIRKAIFFLEDEIERRTGVRQ